MSILLACLAGVPASAEIAVEIDAFGNYVRTTVVSQVTVRQHRVWRAWRSGWGVHVLNPEGDRRGDLFPAVAENSRGGRYPWAVWSRFNGYDYDLAWSRWERGGWLPIRWLTETPEPGDDLGPVLAFDTVGRPFTAWWRDEGGTGRIYLSFFLVTQWLSPLPLSDISVDSREPQLTVRSDGSVEVRYRTPWGIETRVVSLNDPTTITDDLDPVSQMSVSRVNHAP